MIYGPLRDLFRHPNANLNEKLKHLAVLEARFQRRYLQEEIDWIRSFDTDTKFFDNVMTMSPRDLAESLTKSDVDAFSLLQPQSFVNGDSYLQHMNRQWNGRCRAAQDGIIVESRFSHLLADLAKASIALPYCSSNPNAHIRNYEADRIFTACALYCKLYEKPVSTNVKCHTSSLLSMPIRTMALIEKYTEGEKVSHFYLLISGSSERFENTSYRKCCPLEGTRIRKVVHGPGILSSQKLLWVKYSFHGGLESGFISWISYLVCLTSTTRIGSRKHRVQP